MNVVFADTFYYLAWVNSKDANHAKARQFSNSYTGAVVTSAWIITELADALCKSVNKLSFLTTYAMIQSDPNTHVVPLDESLQQRGIALYRSRTDKDWSLTDCVSMLIMQDLGIAEALTGDRHFEQAGFQVLLK